MKRKLVFIKWVDSHSSNGAWRKIEDIVADNHPLHIDSIGWLIAETNVNVTIVPHMHSPEHDDILVTHGCGEITIPKVAILKRKNIRL